MWNYGSASSCRMIKSFKSSSNRCRSHKESISAQALPVTVCPQKWRVMNCILCNCTKYILFWWISSKIEGGMRICCSSITDIMPIHFAINVESCLFTNNEPGSQVTISNFGYAPVANAYHTVTSSSFTAWSSWSSYSFITKCLSRVLEMVAATHDSLSAFTFVRCVGVKYCAVERCIVLTSTLAIMNARFLLGCIVPNKVLMDIRLVSCEILCEIHTAHNSLFLP